MMRYEVEATATDKNVTVEAVLAEPPSRIWAQMFSNAANVEPHRNKTTRRVSLQLHAPDRITATSTIVTDAEAATRGALAAIAEAVAIATEQAEPIEAVTAHNQTAADRVLAEWRTR